MLCERKRLSPLRTPYYSTMLMSSFLPPPSTFLCQLRKKSPLSLPSASPMAFTHSNIHFRQSLSPSRPRPPLPRQRKMDGKQAPHSLPNLLLPLPPPPSCMQLEGCCYCCCILPPPFVPLGRALIVCVVWRRQLWNHETVTKVFSFSFDPPRQPPPQPSQ